MRPLLILFTTELHNAIRVPGPGLVFLLGGGGWPVMQERGSSDSVDCERPGVKRGLLHQCPRLTGEAPCHSERQGQMGSEVCPGAL